MLIIDSLLKFKFFSLGEVRRTLSLFGVCNSSQKNSGKFRARIVQERQLPTWSTCSIPRFVPFKRISLFSTHATLGCHLSHKLDGTELGSVVGLIRAKHREQGVQEFPHYGYDRLQACFAATEQAFIKTPQIRLPAQGH